MFVKVWGVEKKGCVPARCVATTLYIDRKTFIANWRAGFSHPLDAQEFVDGNGTLEGTRAASSGRVSHFFVDPKLGSVRHICLFLIGCFLFSDYIVVFEGVAVVLFDTIVPFFSALSRPSLLGCSLMELLDAWNS